MAKIAHGTMQHLAEGQHHLPEQAHQHTRGHQVHLDITEHTDPNVTVRYESEVSTDGGKTWSYGGGFTRQGMRATDARRYAVVVFGHEPHPKVRLPSGAVTGADPCPHRLVRSRVHIERTDPSAWEQQTVHVPADGTDPKSPTTRIAHPAIGVAKLFSARAVAPLKTAIHVSGSKHAHYDPDSTPEA